MWWDWREKIKRAYQIDHLFHVEDKRQNLWIKKNAQLIVALPSCAASNEEEPIHIDMFSMWSDLPRLPAVWLYTHHIYRTFNSFGFQPILEAQNNKYNRTDCCRRVCVCVCNGYHEGLAHTQYKYTIDCERPGHKQIKRRKTDMEKNVAEIYA